MTVQALHGDCLELMKTLPDKSVDLFICDLPYGQLASNKGGKLNPDNYGQARVNFATEKCDWDVKIDLVKFWEQVERLSKNDNSPVLHFCNTKFGIDLINSKPDWFRYDLVWNKQRGISFLHANKMPMKSHEMIYVFSKKAAFYKRINIPTDKKDYKINRNEDRKHSRHYNISRLTEVNVTPPDSGKRCPLSVIDSPSKLRRGGHPTEKSIDLYKWLIERYCPIGGTVLDPTAGSFNSVLAARELGLNAIGIEMDKKFYDAALTRLGLVPVNEIVEQSQNDQP